MLNYYVAILCGLLVASENGSILVDTTTVGAMATYACDASFTLIGMESRECLVNGSWSGAAPTCEGN